MTHNICMSSNIYLHSAKSKMRYDPEMIVLMVVNYIEQSDHLSFMI